jgi:hypothetical protein
MITNWAIGPYFLQEKQRYKSHAPYSDPKAPFLGENQTSKSNCFRYNIEPWIRACFVCLLTYVHIYVEKNCNFLHLFTRQTF